MEDLSNVTRRKRQLPTSVSTPDRSPHNRKVTRTNNERKVPSSRKSLFSEARKQHKQNEPSNGSENQSTNEDLLLGHSNVDDLLGNTGTIVKVIIVFVTIISLSFLTNRIVASSVNAGNSKINSPRAGSLCLLALAAHPGDTPNK